MGNREWGSDQKGKSKAVQCGVFIFLGTEIGKKQDAVDEIRKKLSGKAFEETVFYAGETPAAKIADEVLNRSLFADHHLFIVKNADQIKKKEEISLIESCIKAGDSGFTIIFLSDEFKLAAGLDNLAAGENRKVFYEMFENEKNEWVRSFFRREGRSIDQSGIDAILEMVENNTDALRRECSRLLLFLPTGRSVQVQDVEQWLSHSREESAFTLFSRIASGDLSKSIESLHTLLAAKETAPGILAGLAWCFRKLRSYLILLESSGGGQPNSFEMKKIGLSSPKAKDDYNAAACRYNIHAVDACLSLTAEYDLLTRASGGLFEQTLMDVYVVKIFSQKTVNR